MNEITNIEEQQFTVNMPVKDELFMHVIKAMIPVSDRSWDPATSSWRFSIKHLNTIRVILGQEAKP